MTESPAEEVLQAHSVQSNNKLEINEMRKLIADQREQDAKKCMKEIQVVLDRYGYGLSASLNLTPPSTIAASIVLIDKR